MEEQGHFNVSVSWYKKKLVTVLSNSEGFQFLFIQASHLVFSNSLKQTFKERLNTMLALQYVYRLAACILHRLC